MTAAIRSLASENKAASCDISVSSGGTRQRSSAGVRDLACALAEDRGGTPLSFSTRSVYHHPAPAPKVFFFGWRKLHLPPQLARLQQETFIQRATNALFKGKASAYIRAWRSASLAPSPCLATPLQRNGNICSFLFYLAA